MRTQAVTGVRGETAHHADCVAYIGQALSSMIFGHSLPHLDAETRAELLQRAANCVTEALDEFAPTEPTEPDAMDEAKYESEGL
jgi:hypothetical protein